MDRLISEQKVLEAVDKVCCGSVEYRVIYDRCEELIKAIPSAEPKRGQWKRRIVDGGHNADWKCSECGYKVYTDFVNYNFCPMCGAKMIEPQESEVNNG